MSDENILEMLKEALNLELWIITLYEDYLNRISDNKIRTDIAKLIQDSVGHAALMRTAINKIKLSMPVEKPVSKEKLKDLLNTGIREEIEAQQLYTKLAGITKDKELVKISKKIFKDEVRHEKIVKNLIKLAEK